MGVVLVFLYISLCTKVVSSLSVSLSLLAPPPPPPPPPPPTSLSPHLFPILKYEACLNHLSLSSFLSLSLSFPLSLSPCPPSSMSSHLFPVLKYEAFSNHPCPSLLPPHSPSPSHLAPTFPPSCHWLKYLDEWQPRTFCWLIDQRPLAEVLR